MYVQRAYCSLSSDHRDAGVFTAAYTALGMAVGNETLEVEAHAFSGPGAQLAVGRKLPESARVTHIVIRLDTRWWELDENDTLANLVRSMADPILQLPFLRTITLEVREREKSSKLMEKLPAVFDSGRLHKRTCQEARDVAQAALRNPIEYTEDCGVVSPLWFSDDFHGWDHRWW